MTGMTLYGRRGWGSVLIEAQLAWYGLEAAFVEVGDLFADPAARDALARVNPLAQVPTLVMADGSVITESAAITLHLADLTGRDDLVPGPADPQRGRFLRWLVHIVANVYPTYTYGDAPARFVPDEAARAGFLAAVNAHAERLYRQLGAEAGRPWFLGDRFSALDIYVGTLTRWRPGPDWFGANAPALTAIGEATRARPELAGVFRRNYPDG